VLTDRQTQLLDFLRRYQRQHGVMPSTRDIQRHFGFASQTAAMGHLRALERKGVIRRLAGMARAVIFSNEEDKSGLLHIPVYGSIPAGFAADNPQFSNEAVGVDRRGLKIGSSAKPFALRVRGDSMIGAHICDGDLVILEHREPKPYDIVAALIDEESTLKRYLVEDGRPFLRAENPNYPDLLPMRELVIQGVMVGLMRAA
jgi:repressor LexA